MTDDVSPDVAKCKGERPGSEGDLPENAGDLSESEVYALLADRRRRLILRLLQDFSPPLSGCEVATLIAESAYDDPPEDRLRSIYLSLHHVHLPKLEEVNVVAWSPEDGSIGPGPNFGTLLGVLEAGDRSRSFPPS